MLYDMVKPDGVEIRVNGSSLEYALSLGWVKAKDAPQQPKPKEKKAYKIEKA